MTAIQPCALLLLVGPDWCIETVSANIAMLGDHRAGDLAGQPLAELIGSKAIHELRNRLAWLSNGESEVQDFGVQWGDVTLDVRATHQAGHYLIEAELAVEPRLPDGIGMVRSMSDRLSGTGPVELAVQAMRQLNVLTGFDRVILYDERGAVIAANQDQVPDRPTELATVARVVADRSSEPVALVGNQDHSLLSRAAFQAPDDEQVEQMAALDVAASVSLPLRIDGDLFGTLCCYHSTPRRVGAERRSVAHLFAERLIARMARRGWREYPLAP